MTRFFGVVSLLAALAVGGYLVSAQLGSTGPTSKTGSSAIAEAGSEVLTLNLQQAALALEQFHLGSGSYAGADVGGFGVALRRADATSYCVESMRAPAWHLTGPGGPPASGAC
ncbi:MAG TPA: hypothetical protein VKB07_05085 [Gaiellaceae bacterium]|nr:hypothetical protein [Gaiellaceae bacterium]